MRYLLPVMLLSGLLLSSCVSKKKFTALEHERDEYRASMAQKEDYLLRTQEELAEAQRQLAQRDTELAKALAREEALQGRLEYMELANTNLLDRMRELSMVSQSGAESIKQSLEVMDKQSNYIQELQGKIQEKDSLNLVLVMNLKRSLADVNDEDVQIEVKGSKVFVSLSDKMLYRSGSAEIQPAALNVLGKVARIIKDHQDLDVLVEGHTDNVPIKTGCLADNWDLSTKRATAVVRVMQWRYGVAPARLTAAGRSEYVPKATNNTAAGRQINRRTEIILTPKMEQYFRLMEAPVPPGAGQ